MGIFSRLRTRRVTPGEAVADPDLMIVDVRSFGEYRSATRRAR